MAGYSAYTDQELVALLRQGGDLAFTEIYGRYWEKMYYIAHKMLKSQEGAEEVVQDTFILLWKKRLTLEINSLPVYLAAMVRYEVYRYLAKDKKQRENETAYQNEQAEYISVDGDIENKLLLEIIAELSNKLPEKCRLVFQYVKLQDRPIGEVAEELNISQKTAEAHLTKALKTIRGNIGNAMHLLF
jgi:RNA polymerase sigma-70 factor (ECF subfamily)